MRTTRPSADGMNLEDVLNFVRAQRLAVVATVSEDGSPEAALMGIVTMPDARIIFDTVKRSRKYSNLRKEKRIAIVVGWNDEITAQLEGVADEPADSDLDRCKDAYFTFYPEGRVREAWPDIAYIGVRLSWIRYCDYNVGGVGVIEFRC